MDEFSAGFFLPPRGQENFLSTHLLAYKVITLLNIQEVRGQRRGAREQRTSNAISNVIHKRSHPVNLWNCQGTGPGRATSVFLWRSSGSRSSIARLLT